MQIQRKFEEPVISQSILENIKGQVYWEYKRSSVEIGGIGEEDFFKGVTNAVTNTPLKKHQSMGVVLPFPVLPGELDMYSFS